MAAGQAALAVAADVAALDALAQELAVQELSRGAGHAAQLRTVLRMHAVGRAAGMELGTVPHAALALAASETRVARLLEEALLLAALPGALEAVQCGLLTVEQSATVVRQLTPLPSGARRAVWSRLQERLLAADACGAVLAPARLAELLRGWVIQADPADAVVRRRRGQDERAVEFRRRPDGLADLFAFGFTGADLQAVLCRIRGRSAPVGPDNDRTAEQRRFDAFKDLLLGRDPLPPHDPHEATGPHETTAPGSCTTRPAGGGRAACGCWPGAPVPCGAQMLVHLSDRNALGTSDVPAELVGHGPLEPDLLQELLLAAPRLGPVWTDQRGVPVAVGDQVVLPNRDDPASVRQALLHLTALPPPAQLHPRHPQDHPAGNPPPGAAPLGGEAAAPPGGGAAAPPGGQAAAPRRDGAAAPTVTTGVARGARPRARLEPPAGHAPSPGDAARLGAAALTAAAAGGRAGSHPAGAPGGYRLPRRLRRLVEVRAPRCEWPGCGARAAGCDAEHDLAWPNGPTCACNLGPCCRRHHRIKQLGWTKTRRHDSAVAWTSPGGGRSWLSPAQHPPPTAPVRPLPALPAPDPLAELAPFQQDEQLWQLADRPDDPEPLQRHSPDPLTADPGPHTDHLGEHLRTGDTRWTLDLDDPYTWQDAADAA